MTRKFLFCFPLRLGNIVFGYIVLIISLAVMAFNLYKLGLGLVSETTEIDEKFRNFEKVDSIFGQQKKELVAFIALLYYSSYIAIGFLLFIFAALFTCGAYRGHPLRLRLPKPRRVLPPSCSEQDVEKLSLDKVCLRVAVEANNCLVSTFFGYCFVHLFLSVGLLVWEALSAGWLELGLIVASDLLLLTCLFSVKYLMEAIRTGNVYSRPGEVYYKY